MIEAKKTQRAIVRIGYDGRVYKVFQGPEAEKRFENECKTLLYLEGKKCPFVPRLISADKEKLEMVTSNCGARVEHMGEERIKELFAELETYGVRHDDPFLRNVTYRASDGRFCIIDFEFSTILEDQPEGLEALDTADQSGDSAQPREYKWSAMTHQGRYRTNNEDRFLAMLIDELGVRYLGKQGTINTADADLLFAVADGMGGERSGELAGKIAIDNIAKILPRAYSMSDRHLDEVSQGILKDLFASIHRELVRLGSFDPLCINMGATLTLVWIHKSLVMFAHVGDTRLYRIRKGEDGLDRMEQISEDHSHVGWLRRTGKINEREARMHPRKNVLAKALGAKNQFAEPQVGSFSLKSNEKLILCSDGVTDGLWDRGIEELVMRPEAGTANQSPAQRLVMTAVAESGRDNATAIVIEC